jgi:hypothetical protein
MESPNVNAAQLGRLEKVKLRTVWADEATDFTPWLAEADNLAQLAEAIGFGADDLELESTEKNVGPFRADVLCKDTAENQWVLIENQLGKTDHGHLGQLLTYAAGLNAVTIVWVAAKFTDEHRAALDWLNEITTAGTDFFGLEIELWKIGNSPAAPKFNLASKPNDWSRNVTRAAGGKEELSDLKQLYLKYWTDFSETVEERSRHLSPRKPRPQHWTNLAVGRSGCRLTARVSSRNEVLAVELGLNDRENAVPFFELLKRDRQQIESEIGETLNWRLKPNKKECAVNVEWEGEDPTDRDRWPRQHEKLADMLDRFYAAFSPRLKQLDPAEYEEARAEEQEDTETASRSPDGLP